MTNIDVNKTKVSMTLKDWAVVTLAIASAIWAGAVAMGWIPVHGQSANPTEICDTCKELITKDVADQRYVTKEKLEDQNKFIQMQIDELHKDFEKFTQEMGKKQDETSKDVKELLKRVPK